MKSRLCDEGRHTGVSKQSCWKLWRKAKVRNESFAAPVTVETLQAPEMNRLDDIG